MAQVMPLSEVVKVRVSKRQLAEVEEVMSELRRHGEKVTLSDFLRNGIDREIAWIKRGGVSPGEYHRSRETKLWNLIADFLHDESKIESNRGD